MALGLVGNFLFLRDTSGDLQKIVTDDNVSDYVPEVGVEVQEQAIVVETAPVSAANVLATPFKDQTQVMSPAAGQTFIVLALPAVANSRIGQIVRYVSITEDIGNVTAAVSGSGTVTPSYSNQTLSGLTTLTFQCISLAGNGTWLRIVE